MTIFPKNENWALFDCNYIPTKTVLSSLVISTYRDDNTSSLIIPAMEILSIFGKQTVNVNIFNLLNIQNIIFFYHADLFIFL